MSAPRPSVVYVMPDKMGGVTNIVSYLLSCRDRSVDHHVVWTHNRLSRDTRFGGRLDATTQTHVEYSLPVENLHAVMRRLAAAIPRGPGVIVASDLLELAMLSTHDVGRAVVLILHGDHDYYYDLAVRHDAVIHAYVAYSRRMYDLLCECLPHRRTSIFWLPYGVPIPDRRRQPATGALRLIFAGRLEHGQKGVLDLPLIDAALRHHGVEARWTIVGDGPDGEKLRTAWPQSDRVRYRGNTGTADVAAAFQEHDVFVLPTRAEGFPVALLEAMAAGVVPVVSAIESGVLEAITPGTNGLTPAVGDIAGFADAIAALDRDRSRLETMSRAAADHVRRNHDLRPRAGAYDALYARYAELYKPLAPDARLQYGSRLDRPWIPNAFVRAVRSAIRATR